jgi:hypothetical protein
MAFDLGILGIILTFLVPGLFQFESAIFNAVNPEDVGRELDDKAEQMLPQLVTRVFRAMDDDVARSTLSLEAQSVALRESLVKQRNYVAQQLGEAILSETTDHLKIMSCFDTWRRWAVHGRFIATVCTFVYLTLFGLLTIMVFTNSLPATIHNYYVWVAFSIVIIPFIYVFICWLVAHYFKESFRRQQRK